MGSHQNHEPRSWFLCRTFDRTSDGAGHLMYTKPDPTLPEIGARLALTQGKLVLR